MNEDETLILAELDMQFDEVIAKEAKSRRRGIFRGLGLLVVGMAITLGFLGSMFLASVAGLAVSALGMHLLMEHVPAWWRLVDRHPSIELLRQICERRRSPWGMD